MSKNPDPASFTDLKKHAESNFGGNLIETIYKTESERGIERDVIRQQMRQHFILMKSVRERSLAVENAAEKERRLLMISGCDSTKINDTSDLLTVGLGEIIRIAQAAAFATSEANAAGFRIVKAPTAGSVGVIPGAFMAVNETLGIADADIVDGLIVAGAIGGVIKRRATFAAAEAGCGAEVGAAVGMAAGGVAWIFSKNAETVETAAAMALQNYLGLECSSLAGAVEIPCAHRCATGAVVALSCASMACAGVQFPIRLDEVVDVMYAIGKALPAAYRETQGAGLAKTESGIELSSAAYSKRRHQQQSCNGCNKCA
ncbi:MAG TPA: L-serine ammonia-lyase, iron-sulfur-dependent, subunit alpha [Pyrinomonadaceae bacterium]|jgi:L-serine dehydratase